MRQLDHAPRVAIVGDCDEGDASKRPPTLRFSWGVPFRGLTTVRFRLRPVDLLAPLSELTRFSDQNVLKATQNSWCRAVNRRRGRCACRASNWRRRASFSRTRSTRQRKALTNQPRKYRSETIM